MEFCGIVFFTGMFALTALYLIYIVFKSMQKLHSDIFVFGYHKIKIFHSDLLDEAIDCILSIVVVGSQIWIIWQVCLKCF